MLEQTEISRIMLLFTKKESQTALFFKRVLYYSKKSFNCLERDGWRNFRNAFASI